MGSLCRHQTCLDAHGVLPAAVVQNVLHDGSIARCVQNGVVAVVGQIAVVQVLVRTLRRVVLELLELHSARVVVRHPRCASLAFEVRPILRNVSAAFTSNWQVDIRVERVLVCVAGVGVVRGPQIWLLLVDLNDARDA